MTRTLQSLRVELDFNRKRASEIAKYYAWADSMHNYLHRHTAKDLTVDSLDYYLRVPDSKGHTLGVYNTFDYQQNVFEMMKYSGVMSLIDIKLLNEIWKTYKEMEYMKNFQQIVLDRRFKLVDEAYTKFHITGIGDYVGNEGFKAAIESVLSETHEREFQDMAKEIDSLQMQLPKE